MLVLALAKPSSYISTLRLDLDILKQNYKKEKCKFKKNSFFSYIVHSYSFITGSGTHKEIFKRMLCKKHFVLAILVRGAQP